jgi:hypothetical protein
MVGGDARQCVRERGPARLRSCAAAVEVRLKKMRRMLGVEVLTQGERNRIVSKT